MPTADFFCKLGMYVDRSFLTPELCAELVATVSTVHRENSAVVDGGTAERTIKLDVRRTKTAYVSTSTIATVHQKILSLKEPLQKHFSVALQSFEKPDFLVYEEGDFFRAHADSDDAASKPDYIKRRKLSLIVFLNSETAEPSDDSFCGGSLVMYGLMKSSQWQHYGFSLSGEAGLLIAFPSHLVHEVMPVTGGRRFSIVTWAY